MIKRYILKKMTRGGVLSLKRVADHIEREDARGKTMSSKEIVLYIRTFIRLMEAE